MPVMSVALVDDERLLGCVAAAGEGSRNEKLLPAIDWLLTEAKVARSQLSCIAVTRGPGSFTGTRVGLATAQGLSLALGVPLLTMGTHEAAAESSAAVSVVVSGEAGRDELYVSCFERRVLVSGPQLLARTQLEPLALEADEALVMEALCSRLNLALLCAQRALRLESEGQGSLHRDATPLYVRLAEAEVQLQMRQVND